MVVLVVVVIVIVVVVLVIIGILEETPEYALVQRVDSNSYPEFKVNKLQTRISIFAMKRIFIAMHKHAYLNKLDVMLGLVIHPEKKKTCTNPDDKHMSQDTADDSSYHLKAYM